MIAIKGNKVSFDVDTATLETDKVYKLRFELHFPDGSVVADEKSIKVRPPISRKIIEVKK